MANREQQSELVKGSKHDLEIMQAISAAKALQFGFFKKLKSGDAPPEKISNNIELSKETQNDTRILEL